MSKLIVIDGLDGCGKTTQYEQLTKMLARTGKAVLPVSFPDYGEQSSTLVQLYLSGGITKDANEVNPYAASVFYSADRYISFKKHWEDAWEKGVFVLAARYTTSNIIHQMSKLPRESWDYFIAWLEHFEYKLMGLPKPDRVLFLDMPLEVTRALLSKRYLGDASQEDIHESNLAYMERCRECALYAADKLGWSVITCSENLKPRAIRDISKDIWESVEPLI